MPINAYEKVVNCRKLKGLPTLLKMVLICIKDTRRDNGTFSQLRGILHHHFPGSLV